MSRTTLASLAVLLCLLGSGCRSVATEGEVRAQLSPGSVLLSVESVSEKVEGSCGLACLTSLLRYHDLDLDVEAARRFPLDKIEKEWISAGELREYLISRGFRANLVHGKLDATRPAGLFFLLDRGLPVIVARSVKGSEHFDLVCGYEPVKRWVFLMSPQGVRCVSYDRFEEGWSAVDHLALVAAPTTKLRLASAEPQPVKVARHD